ncbi:MAG: hypothetical protein EXR79_12850 [Myxococcales bacterium]|nr:hypothetical protein [Myxococcales bacterium]
MRVVFPAAMDTFACVDPDCACRLALRAAPRAVTAAKPKLPARDAVAAVVDGAAWIAGSAGEAGVAGAAEHGYGDFPIGAVGTPHQVELTFDTLCPEVRRLLAAVEEPTGIAGSDGGWRQGLRVFQPDHKNAQVRLTPRKSVRWVEFEALREALLDVAAEPTETLLAQLTRVAVAVDAAVTDQVLSTTVAPLTPRTFVAFRAFVETRAHAAGAEALAEFAGKTLPLWGADVGLKPGHLPTLLDALHGDWRAQLRARVVPHERELLAPLDAWLGMRLFAIPIDRDQSLVRGHTELLEGFAVGLRYLAALGETLDCDADALLAVTALALGEHFVLDTALPLPAFEVPRDAHDRGPRMADLDLTLESLC